MAILAGGLVLGVGGAFTLAVWNDTEWAYGGNGIGGPGVGTSAFAVQQNVTAPFTTPFTDASTNPGSSLQFAPTPLAMTPGDVIFAPIALKTTASSPVSVGGTLQLRQAVAASGVTIDDPGGSLWSALHLSVGVSENNTTCDAAAFSAPPAGFTVLLNDQTGLSSGAAITGPQTLQAAGANTLYYCFKVELPAGSPNTLMGRTVAPAWEFFATSTP